MVLDETLIENSSLFNQGNLKKKKKKGRARESWTLKKVEESWKQKSKRRFQQTCLPTFPSDP